MKTYVRKYLKRVLICSSMNRKMGKIKEKWLVNIVVPDDFLGAAGKYTSCVLISQVWLLIQEKV